MGLKEPSVILENSLALSGNIYLSTWLITQQFSFRVQVPKTFLHVQNGIFRALSLQRLCMCAVSVCECVYLCGVSVCKCIYVSASVHESVCVCVSAHAHVM